MKSLIFISIYIFLVQEAFAQAPDIIWQKSLGGSDYDQPIKIITESDSNYFIIGDTRSTDFDIESSHGSRDIWTLYINGSGNLLWERTYGGSSIDLGGGFYSLDGDYNIFSGSTYSIDGEITDPNGNSDFWIVKTNEVSDIVWEHNYGGSNAESAYEILPILGEGFIVIGKTESIDGDVSGLHGLSNSDIWVLKIDNFGNIVWQKCYGSINTEYAYSVVKTLDNCFVIAGSTSGDGGDVIGNHGSTDLWVIKIDSNGELIWQKCYGGSEYEISRDILGTEDGGFLLVGETESNNGDVMGFHGGIYDGWVLKLDSDGNIQWQKCFGGSGSDAIYSIISLNDGNYLFAGRSTSSDGDLTENMSGNDCWLVKINPEGDIIWQKSFGGFNEDIAYDIIETQNEEIIFLAQSMSSDGDLTLNMGNWDFWVVRLGYCTTKYFADADGDGFGDIILDSLACELPIGYVSDSTDCNDLNPEIHPTLTDICNAIDDNCNGLTDEDATFVTYFADIDGDTFGDILNDSTTCNELIGYVLDNTDCNDLNPEIHPTLTDNCNTIDDNCNGLTDEDATFVTYFADIDGDNFGDVLNDSTTCNELIGYVLDNTDCNDSNNAIYPGATEICNYLDDDCDGITDDNVTFIQSFIDADNDNFGNPDFDSIACEIPPGYVLSNTDCNDTNPDIYPGAPELLNGLDDDCDQIADEDLAITDIVKSTISIYPNPVNAVLFIQSNESQKITIVNQLGETILFANLFNGLNTISVADFASGVYWVKAEDGEMVVWVKGE